MVPADLLDRLTAIDTPTICNALEVLAPTGGRPASTACRWSARSRR